MACIETIEKYQDELKSTSDEIDAARKKLEQIEMEKSKIEKKLMQQRRAIEEAKKNYDDAVKLFPSPWKTLLYKAIDGVTEYTVVLLAEYVKQQVTPKPSVCDIIYTGIYRSFLCFKAC